jgi:hypothetical protein
MTAEPLAVALDHTTRQPDAHPVQSLRICCISKHDSVGCEASVPADTYRPIGKWQTSSLCLTFLLHLPYSNGKIQSI